MSPNRRAELIFDRSRLSLVGEAIGDLVSRPNPESDQAHAQRPDGSEIPVEISEAPFRADDDEFVVLALRDVSERVARDEERRRLEAEPRSRQRLESLGTLAGGIAHDFNNLLAAIVANAELAASGPEQVGPALDEIRAASSRGRDLVARILAIGPRQRATRQDIPLGPVLLEVGRLLRATLPSNIELLLETPETEIAASVDPTQIHQVVLNLATNAWHAIGSSSGHIRISLDLPDESPASPPQARIRVADDGAGLSPEVLEPRSSLSARPSASVKALASGSRSHTGSCSITAACSAPRTRSVSAPS